MQAGMCIQPTASAAHFDAASVAAGAAVAEGSVFGNGERGTTHPTHVRVVDVVVRILDAERHAAANLARLELELARVLATARDLHDDTITGSSFDAQLS